MCAIAASILGCKHAAIGEAVKRAEAAGADSIHIDVMDGDYVDNLSFGPQLVHELGELTGLPLCLHLETKRPDRYFRLFRDSSAAEIAFQLDACSNPLHLIREIRKSGKRVGIGLGPAFAVETLRYVLPYLDSVIVMSVEPGYGGQPFESSVYQKLRQVRQLAQELGLAKVPTISVDGGVNVERIPRLVQEGADVLICGTSAFLGNRIEENLAALREAEQKARQDCAPIGANFERY